MNRLFLSVMATAVTLSSTPALARQFITIVDPLTGVISVISPQGVITKDGNNPVAGPISSIHTQPQGSSVNLPSPPAIIYPSQQITVFPSQSVSAPEIQIISADELAKIATPQIIQSLIKNQADITKENHSLANQLASSAANTSPVQTPSNTQNPIPVNQAGLDRMREDMDKFLANVMAELLNQQRVSDTPAKKPDNANGQKPSNASGNNSLGNQIADIYQQNSIPQEGGKPNGVVPTKLPADKTPNKPGSKPSTKPSGTANLDLYTNTSAVNAQLQLQQQQAQNAQAVIKIPPSDKAPNRGGNMSDNTSGNIILNRGNIEAGLMIEQKLKIAQAQATLEAQKDMANRMNSLFGSGKKEPDPMNPNAPVTGNVLNAVLAQQIANRIHAETKPEYEAMREAIFESARNAMQTMVDSRKEQLEQRRESMERQMEQQIQQAIQMRQAARNAMQEALLLHMHQITAGYFVIENKPAGGVIGKKPNATNNSSSGNSNAVPMSQQLIGINGSIEKNPGKEKIPSLNTPDVQTVLAAIRAEMNKLIRAGEFGEAEMQAFMQQIATIKEAYIKAMQMLGPTGNGADEAAKMMREIMVFLKEITEKLGDQNQKQLAKLDNIVKVEEARLKAELEKKADPWASYIYVAKNQPTANVPTTGLYGTAIAYYEGLVNGKVGGDEVNGKFKLDVNLTPGSEKMNGSMNFGDKGTLYITEYYTKREGGAISGDLVGGAFGGNIEGRFNGKLYGPKAEQVGGTWDVSVYKGGAPVTGGGRFIGAQVHPK